MPLFMVFFQKKKAVRVTKPKIPETIRCANPVESPVFGFK
jgi:hypothetical protein